MDTAEREHRRARAAELVDDLLERDVVAVAVTWVDHSGITRVKSVPVAGLPRAAADGLGASPVFDAFLLDDTIVAGRHAGGPVGDLRLHPDLDRLTVLAAQPGWAWAPADRYDRDGAPHPQDERGLARAVADRLAVHGYEVRAGFEVEWVVGAGGTDEFRPATTGPAYGHARQVELSDYTADLMSALADQDVEVLQFHPEYAPGQFELSTAPEDPVHAADTSVLVRETVRAITARHGMRASFSPKVTAEGVGNGGHLHLSLWRDGRNLFGGGDGWFGMTDEAEWFSGGVLARLPALCAIGAPSVAGYLRLVPRHWAAPYAVWGLENREAALRLVAGRDLEVRCFDLTANPYLAVAATMAAGLAGLVDRVRLPEPVGVDPADLPDGVRLPASLEEAVAAFEADEVLAEAFGAEFAATIADVRRGEIARFAGCSPEEVAALTRWRH
ncbi:glutamine synthetase family protein [Saccharothrix syringae]|uniref:Glutamine synthetase n=1 Tax=Saccharothrix syringae TaxID=103733 RepID=A0A5Q0H8P8_SACSY|nr:glutamine synthetase family protein [Saccharothrix syringae]QFZ22597.1 glutamine synthetase [Saccharothrix syringae]